MVSPAQHGPRQYLDEVMRVLPYWPKHRYLELAPKYWQATRTNLDPAELDAELYPITVCPRSRSTSHAELPPRPPVPRPQEWGSVQRLRCLATGGPGAAWGRAWRYLGFTASENNSARIALSTPRGLDGARLRMLWLAAHSLC